MDSPENPRPQPQAETEVFQPSGPVYWVEDGLNADVQTAFSIALLPQPDPLTPTQRVELGPAMGNAYLEITDGKFISMSSKVLRYAFSRDSAETGVRKDKLLSFLDQDLTTDLTNIETKIYLLRKMLKMAEGLPAGAGEDQRQKIRSSATLNMTRAFESTKELFDETMNIAFFIQEVIVAADSERQKQSKLVDELKEARQKLWQKDLQPARLGTRSEDLDPDQVIWMQKQQALKQPTRFLSHYKKFQETINSIIPKLTGLTTFLREIIIPKNTHFLALLNLDETQVRGLITQIEEQVLNTHDDLTRVINRKS